MTVSEVLTDRPGLQRVRVRSPEPAAPDERAYVLTQLTGPVALGDDVIVNTTAVELGLGTGGWHVVHWNLARDAWTEPGPGHIMKLRYTSLQADTGAGEELHPHLPTSLEGAPVVVASLHSQVPGIVAAVHAARPDARVSYVMTDGAALPIAFSDLVVALREADLIQGTVTAGHAFGGDLEAVTVPSALVLARHVQHADVIVVAMGPGVVGTGTTLGTTALEVAPILDAAAALGGLAILCPRVSTGDARARHQGLSHHTVTALGLRRAPALVGVPPTSIVGFDLGGLLAAADPTGLVEVVPVAAPDAASLLAEHGLRVTTMGRGPEAEPGFFATTVAAGALAAARIAAPAG